MEYVVIGPGAMAFFSLYGAMCASIDKEKLKEISGSSAGALAALCFLLDVPIQKCLEVDNTEVFKPNVKCFLGKYGFVPRKRIIKVLVDFFGRDWTFKELYEETGKVLYIAVSCLDPKMTVYHSVKTSPNDSVLGTLATSMSIPIMFEPERRGSNIYFDGSVYEDTPGAPFIGHPHDSVCQFSMKYTENDHSTKKGLMQYIVTLLNNFMSLRSVYHYPTRIVYVSKEDTFNFNASYDSKLQMFIKGMMKFS